MELSTAIGVIDDFLHDRLRHTGSSGFEGLVSLVMQAATGQEFRLSSSGRQSGSDSGSESGYGNTIRIEAKHYRTTTPLHLRELLAEIDEAAESNTNLDIWVLAASRSVDEQMARSLEAHAETYGIEILLLDLGINGLPRLAVLLAAFPDLAIDWATRNRVSYDANELRAALAAIAVGPDFEASKNRLFAKLSSLSGYDSARRLIRNRLLTIVSETGMAQSEFCQSLGIRTQDAHVVRRTELNRRFDQWWEVVGCPSPAGGVGRRRNRKDMGRIRLGSRTNGTW